MNNTTAPSKTTKNITAFFVLTFLITLPAYILIALTSKNIILSPELAFAFLPLATLAPISAALILTFKENGWDGVKKLFSRIFDHKRIVKKIWYVPTLFLIPFLVILALGVSVLMELPLLDAPFPIVVLPVVFLLFFITASSEQVGWMGYAFEPMQDKWSTFKATLALGSIWALWHIPIYIFLIVDPVSIGIQCLGLVALRFLQVWLFTNTGKSLFAVILCHAMYNVAISMLPANLIIISLFFFITAIVVTFLWGPETMAKFRWKKANVLS